MGWFTARLVETNTGREALRWDAPNILMDEGAEAVYRRIFPPLGSPLTLHLGVSGPGAAYPEHRPNSGGGIIFGRAMTLTQCIDDAANEGGGYTDAMRASFGYSRHAATFVLSDVSDGGEARSDEATFANLHEWSPQAAEDWNRPWTRDQIEQPPPEWEPRESWEPVVGYPWQRPRKRCADDCDPDDPAVCLRSYMYSWDPTGELNWLCDLRKIGGFPLTLAWIGDVSRGLLVAAAQFRAPVLLRPGLSLRVRYTARISGPRMSRDFALRFARRIFSGASAYDAIYCRPLLATVPIITRRTTYDDIVPHMVAHFPALTISSWTYSATPEPHVVSGIVPSWSNMSGEPIGPIWGVAVYGEIGATRELMYCTPFDTAATVPHGDILRVPDRLRFTLVSI